MRWADVSERTESQSTWYMWRRAAAGRCRAADVDPADAEFMADSQVPWGVAVLDGKTSKPAWKTKPSWHLVATDDRMIPPPA